MTFERPSGNRAWRADWFLWFFSLLEMPDGTPVKVEPFTRLIIREIFATGRVELLVLIPKGNGKTALVAALAIWHLLTRRNANCFIGAADRVQADEMYRFAAHFVESEPELQALLLVRRGTREIRAVRDQGFLLVLASDDSRQGGKRQGFNPTLAILDELHAHANDNLYVDMRSGLFKNRGLLITITTAGWDSRSVLGMLRANFLKAGEHGGTVAAGLVVNGEGNPEQHPDGRLTIARVGRNAMLEWACRPDEDYFNPEIAKLANPATWVTIDSLQDAIDAPGITPWAFARYRCNVWTVGFESWIPLGSWDRNYDPLLRVVEHRTWEGADPRDVLRHVERLFEPKSPVVAAIDMARYRDTAAVSAIGPRADGRKVVRAVIFRSGGPDNPVKYDWPKAVISHLRNVYRLEACGFDPRYFDQSAEELKDDGVPMELFPQSDARMCVAAGNARAEIIEGEFAHDGDPILKAHMEAGRAKDVGPNAFRVDRQDGRGAPPTDGCIATLMANQLLKGVVADSGDPTIFFI